MQTRLPPVAAVAAGALLLLCAALRPVPAPAAEDDSAYTATVPVDASADSADKARDLARRNGERKALAAVVAKLGGNPDAPQLAKLDERAIGDMVLSLEVANEHMSAVRYLADYTFHFDPAKVKPLVGSAAANAGANPTAAPANAASASGAGPSGVVLPLWVDGGKPVLWDDPNPWRAAWRQASAPAQFQVPLGDLDDLQTIDERRAAAGDPAALGAIAQKSGAKSAVVALATLRRQEGQIAGLDLTLKRYESGRLVGSQSRSIDANPGESEGALLRRAIAATIADLGNPGKPETAEGTGATLAAIVPIDSLAAWIAVRDRLGSVPGVRTVELLSLTQSEAKIAIHYVGDADSLKASLKASAFTLAGGEPVWKLQVAAAAKRP